jgi:hypothetical protein
MTKSIWIVTYWGENESPSSLLYDNEESARSCYENLKELHEHCTIDFAPIYDRYYK